MLDTVTQQTLVCLGAGPKSLAIAAKVAALTTLGCEVPKLIIVERSQVAAHWCGRFGFTNGQATLGTRPEKDIGFPYASYAANHSLSQQLNREMARFSWMQFLITNDAYQPWVDRGCPRPSHQMWADYLQWVWKEARRAAELIHGTITAVDLVDDTWSIDVSGSGAQGDTHLTAQGIVFTGPGTSRRLLTDDRVNGIFEIHHNWNRLAALDLPQNARIGIIGGGESAASVATYLSRMYPNRYEILMLAPSGLYTRSEGYFENRVYSNPQAGRWNELSDEDRHTFMHRTDRGVVSPEAMAELAADGNIRLVPGRVEYVKATAGGYILQVANQGDALDVEVQFLVNCTGFDPLAQVRHLLTANAQRKLEAVAHVNLYSGRSVEHSIDTSLAVGSFAPYLHLPSMARYKQGPGFANLSSLGLLSDRVLSRYVPELGHILEPYDLGGAGESFAQHSTIVSTRVSVS